MDDGYNTDEARGKPYTHPLKVNFCSVHQIHDPAEEEKNRDEKSSNSYSPLQEQCGPAAYYTSSRGKQENTHKCRQSNQSDSVDLLDMLFFSFQRLCRFSRHDPDQLGVC